MILKKQKEVYLDMIIREYCIGEVNSWGHDPRVQGYIDLINDIGAEQFAYGLVAAMGDMSGHPQGHESIVKYIRGLV